MGCAEVPRSPKVFPHRDDNNRHKHEYNSLGLMR